MGLGKKNIITTKGIYGQYNGLFAVYKGITT
jgi:hypothetical protein